MQGVVWWRRQSKPLALPPRQSEGRNEFLLRPLAKDLDILANRSDGSNSDAIFIHYPIANPIYRPGGLRIEQRRRQPSQVYSAHLIHPIGTFSLFLAEHDVQNAVVGRYGCSGLPPPPRGIRDGGSDGDRCRLPSSSEPNESAAALSLVKAT